MLESAEVVMSVDGLTFAEAGNISKVYRERLHVTAIISNS